MIDLTATIMRAEAELAGLKEKLARDSAQFHAVVTREAKATHKLMIAGQYLDVEYQRTPSLERALAAARTARAERERILAESTPSDCGC